MPPGLVFVVPGVVAGAVVVAGALALHVILKAVVLGALSCMHTPDAFEVV